MANQFQFCKGYVLEQKHSPAKQKTQTNLQSSPGTAILSTCSISLWAFTDGASNTAQHAPSASVVRPVSLHLAKFQISFLLCLHWYQQTQVKSSLLPNVTPSLPRLPRQTGWKGYLVSVAVKSSFTSAYSSGLLVLFSTVSFDPQSFVILKSGLKGEMPELRIFIITMCTG